MLPLGVPAVTADVSTGNPAWALLGLLAVSIGLPFFVVSSTAPLLQRWLVHTDHPAGRDPYFLYRASNFGSVIGLVSYPLLVEPGWRWTTRDSCGRGATPCCRAAAGLRRLRLAVGHARASWRRRTEADEQLTVRRRLTWLVLAFVPSSLIVAGDDRADHRRGADPAAVGAPARALPALVHARVLAGKGARGIYTASVWLLPPALLLVLVVTVSRCASRCG